MAQRPLNGPPIACQTEPGRGGGNLSPLVGFRATKSLGQRLTTPELLSDMRNMLVPSLRTKYPTINYSVLRHIAAQNKILLRHVPQPFVPTPRKPHGGARTIPSEKREPRRKMFKERREGRSPYRETRHADWDEPNGVLAKVYGLKVFQVRMARQYWTGKTTHER